MRRRCARGRRAAGSCSRVPPGSARPGWPGRRCGGRHGRARQTRWAYGTASARSTPFGAFEGLLGDLGSDPAGIVRRAVESLGSLSGPRPLIAIDDAHELDELSALVVHNLVVRDAATVLVTLRSGEQAPDAVTSLWKDEHLPRLELQALSAAETTALLEQVLDAPVDSTGADRLWSLSQGNLLFLRHLVDGELRSGRLRKVAGIWQWPETPELTRRAEPSSCAATWAS